MAKKVGPYHLPLSIEDEDFREDILDMARFARSNAELQIGLLIDENERVDLDDAEVAGDLYNLHYTATELIDAFARLGYGLAVDIRRVQGDHQEGA